MSSKLISEVRRSVRIENKNIILETEIVDNTEYAFYLSHKNGTEKVFYSLDSEAGFFFPDLQGEYTARFFYKNHDGIEYVRAYFIIDNLGRVFFSEIDSIIDEDKYSIDYYFNNSDTTFIVFNGDGSKKTTPPFGLSYLIKKGFNVIAVKQENDRYQSLSYSAFKEIVTPIVKDKRVFLYGSSLGGYCALYYAGAVNGVVIAAAPRNPIHPSIKNLLKTNGEYLHKKINQHRITDRYVLVILDPTNEVDKLFFEEVVLPSYPNLRLLQAPYAGHEVLLHLNYTGELKSILSDVITEDYLNIKIDNSLDSPYKDKTIALDYFSKKDYRSAILYTAKALKVSDKEKLDTQLLSLLNASLNQLSR